MKKIKLFFVLAAMVALCVGFSSCDRNPLVGTTWIQYGDNMTTTIIFTTQNSGTFIHQYNEEWLEEQFEGQQHGISPISYPFTYTFNDPNITISNVENFDGSFSIEGEVLGNVMILEESGNRMVFTRR